MLLTLWLPIILSGVALFIASFVSWMVVQLHRRDWVKLPDEDGFMSAVRRLGVGPGSYSFPHAESSDEMRSEAFAQKWQQGPAGVITVFPAVSMPRNLGLTFVYFLAVAFCVAYLATLALAPGAESMAVFRFVATAGWLAFLPAILQHAIWFHCRVLGHVIESIAYAVVIGLIFAALWPAA